MPVARIITEHAEESLELAIQLRSRGFEVETVSPSQVPDTPADLEIQLDACGADQILEQVMGASTDEDLHVFVAPGALDESFSPPIRLTPPSFKRPPVDAPDQLSEVASVTSSDSAHDRSSISSTVPAATPTELESPEPLVAHFDFEETEIATNRVQEVEDKNEYSAEAPAKTGVAGLEVERATPLTVFETSDVPQPEVEPALSVPVSRSLEPKAAIRASHSRPADTLFLRVAILAAALATAVVLVGSVWQQRHPAAGSLPTAGSQQIPFQRAQGQDSSGQKRAEQKSAEQKPPQMSPTSSPASAPVMSSAPTPPGGIVHAAQTPLPASPQAAATPPPAAVKAPATAPQHVSAKTPSPKKKPPQAQHHSAHTGDSGLIAKDTVVYFNHKNTTPTSSANSTTKQ